MAVARRFLVLVTLLLVALTQQISAKQLTLWHSWSPPRDQILAQVLDTFAKANPGITVQATYMNTKDALEKYLTAAVAGTGPDVIMMQETNIFGLKDTLVPLDKFTKEDKLTKDMWYPSEYLSGIIDGVRYGLPARTGGDATSLFYYNRQHFAEVGLDINNPPATWDQLQVAMKRLNRYDGDKLSRTSFNPIYSGDYTPMTWIYNGGGRMTDDSGHRMMINSPESVDALKTLANMMASSFRSPTDFDVTLGTEAFSKEQLSMAIGGSWLYSQIRTWNPGLDFAMALRPARLEGGNRGMYGWTFLYGINANTKETADAWALVRWLSVEKEGVGELMLLQGRPSPIKRHNVDRRYQDMNPFWPLIGEALTSVVYAPMTPKTVGVYNLLMGDNIQKGPFAQMIRGQIPLEATLDDINRRGQAILDEYWKGK